MGQRYFVPVSTKLDNNGNGIVASERIQTWSELTIVLGSTQQLGSIGPNIPSMQWEVTISGQNKLGAFVGSAVGKTLQSGPHIVAPGEYIVVSVANGNPSDTISGVVFGVQGLDPQTFIAGNTPTTTTIGSGSGAANLLPTFLGFLNIPTNVAPNSFTTTIPPYTTFIRVALGAGTGLGQALQITVVGVQTGNTYLNVSGTANAQLQGFFDTTGTVIDPNDTQVTITVTVAGGSSANVSAWAFCPPYALGLDRASLVGTILNSGSIGQQGNYNPVSVTVPATSGTNTTLVAANTLRRGLAVLCDHATGTLYINVGASNSQAQVRLPPAGYWEMPSPIYTGQVTFTTTTTSQGGAVHASEIT